MTPAGARLDHLASRRLVRNPASGGDRGWLPGGHRGSGGGQGRGFRLPRDAPGRRGRSQDADQHQRDARDLFEREGLVRGQGTQEHARDRVEQADHADSSGAQMGQAGEPGEVGERGGDERRERETSGAAHVDRRRGAFDRCGDDEEGDAAEDELPGREGNERGAIPTSAWPAPRRPRRGEARRRRR